jgi:hypothetical protein
MTDSGFRASDADRQRVVSELEQHTAAGRLTLDEYAQRVDRALAARTHGDLSVVMADLPVDGSSATAEQRHLLIAFGLAALVVAVFAIVLTIAR